ncbi:unnamed protein product [Agarophyton chilense]
MANYDSKFETFTPRPGAEKRSKPLFFNVSSDDSTQAVLNEKIELNSLAGMVGGLRQTSSRRSPVSRKSETHRVMMVDEIDRESASMKVVPTDFTRGRFSRGTTRFHVEDKGHRTSERSGRSFQGYGKEVEDRIVRRARERIASNGVRRSLDVLTVDEHSEMSSTELAMEICPESFHRNRQVGANDAGNEQYHGLNMKEKNVSQVTTTTEEQTELE